MTYLSLLILSLLCAAQGVWAQSGWQSPSKHSQLGWSGDPNAHLDIKRWILFRDLQDVPSQEKERPGLLQPLAESVGRVVSCMGDCQLFRGGFPSRAVYQTRLEEGDEIHTGKESYLWLMLIDGTLVRLAPESTLSFLEVNIADQEVFFYARLGQGYVHWQPRSRELVAVDEFNETDALFLPLREPSVNLEYFQRQRSQEQIGEDMQPYLDTRQSGRKEQLSALNLAIERNNSYLQRKHRVLLVTPNGSFLGEDMGINWFYGLAGSSYLKSVISNGGRARIYFRGYGNDRIEELKESKWFEMDPDGRELKVVESDQPLLAVSELLTKRIPTIQLLREQWLEQERNFWASLAGYRRWGPEQEQRVNFLLEHTRRSETTNLRALQKLIEEQKLDATLGQGFEAKYFSRALEAYYLHLKQWHIHSRASVKDMKDVHYYGWVLRNAKQH